ncbi:MAG: sialate O-acetylesterase [Phycisphaerales bacterium]|nr:sialate O-acetylesterase [Phycisphaerales bacterium]
MFSSHMVLQRNMPVPVWGWDKPGQRVSVSFAGQKAQTTAASDGYWIVRLAPMHASSQPRVMRIGGSTVQQLTDVLVGDVWLCSGQSNMQYPLRGWTRGGGARKEVPKANYPLIRAVYIPMVLAGSPAANVNAARWQICTPATAANFTAVGYYFARDLQRKLHIPIGIIESYWGGTNIHSWLPRSVFMKTPELKFDRALIVKAEEAGNALNKAYMLRVANWLKAAKTADAAGKMLPEPPSPPDNPMGRGPWQPTSIYNAMIHPLAPYAIKGALWYQGENNVGRTLYRYELPALITSWRKLWHQGDFPFYVVQIAPFAYGRPWDKEAARVWQAEEDTVKTVPNTGMVGTMDIGMLHNIHPFDKRDVGYRLSLLALAKTYGTAGVTYLGPTFKAMSIKDNAAIISFSHVAGGLKSRNGQPINWFEIAGRDHKFVLASAKIVGDAVMVSAPGVAHPVAVRYGWNDRIEKSNLENSAGLPAMPFATDVHE